MVEGLTSGPGSERLEFVSALTLVLLHDLGQSLNLLESQCL